MTEFFASPGPNEPPGSCFQNLMVELAEIGIDVFIPQFGGAEIYINTIEDANALGDFINWRGDYSTPFDSLDEFAGNLRSENAFTTVSIFDDIDGSKGVRIYMNQEDAIAKSHIHINCDDIDPPGGLHSSQNWMDYLSGSNFEGLPPLAAITMGVGAVLAGLGLARKNRGRNGGGGAIAY